MLSSNELIILCGALATSLIAGCFSYLTLITSKEQKISEFRQAWIDSLRDSISMFISSVSYIAIYYKHLISEKNMKQTNVETTKEIQEIYINLNKYYNDIIFRVNDNEKDVEGKRINDAFLKKLNEVRDQYNNSKYDETFSSGTELRKLTNPLLKYEWNRVKNGEKAYKRAKNIALLFLAAGIVLLIILFYLIICKERAFSSHNTA